MGIVNVANDIDILPQEVVQIRNNCYHVIYYRGLEKLFRFCLQIAPRCP